MDFQLKIDIKKPDPLIQYPNKILLMGSCFTEHIGKGLADMKFDILQNPNGILFGADAVCSALNSYIKPRIYSGEDLFILNDCWNSWHHHSRFSHPDVTLALDAINKSQQEAHLFLKSANYLIVTLGSAFTYELSSTADRSSLNLGDAVANCHRAPADWFQKQLMSIDAIVSTLGETVDLLREFNPSLKIMFTISPVRHIRDGVVENNRSKARLIEAVHQIVSSKKGCFYFPAYEIVIDVLRDYRFYDIDMVHPNYAATEYVMERFLESCVEEHSLILAQEVKKIVIASRHRPLQPDTNLHKQFLQNQALKTKNLLDKFPFLNLKDELIYFESGI
jgi:hypothetical protein